MDDLLDKEITVTIQKKDLRYIIIRIFGNSEPFIISEKSLAKTWRTVTLTVYLKWYNNRATVRQLFVSEV